MSDCDFDDGMDDFAIDWFKVCFSAAAIFGIVAFFCFLARISQ